MKLEESGNTRKKGLVLVPITGNAAASFWGLLKTVKRDVNLCQFSNQNSLSSFAQAGGVEGRKVIIKKVKVNFGFTHLKEKKRT